MKHPISLKQLPLLYFLILLPFLPFTGYGQAGDPIKPLPRIDKEFLIVAHIVLDKDSNSAIIPEALENEVAVVNQIFAPIGATFTICEYRYIYNFQYDILDMKLNEDNELYTTYSVKNRINIFFLEEVEGLSIAVCGFASGTVTSPGLPAIVIKENDCANATVIAHELGHYFGLPHTFNDDVTTDELADGSNCETAGDGFCDTPADPYVSGDEMDRYINSSCIFINTAKKDANGDYYDPDVSNIMGYYSECRCLKFTRQQYEYMANYYMSNPFVW